MCVLSVLAALAVTTVRAEEEASDETANEATSGEVIVTAARHAQALREYAGSVTVVGPEQVALVGSTHHSEIMNRVPGAMIQRNSGQESLTAIRSPVLSGPGSCGVFLFLEDSIPIRPVGFCNVNELFEVDTEQAQAIEILRGPAGVVYGSSAMHGAVNVLQPTPRQMPAHNVGLEIGSDDYYRAKLGVRHLGESFDIGANAVVTDDGGWRADSGFREQKLGAVLAHPFGDSTFDLRLDATNLNQETAGFIQGAKDIFKNESIAKSNQNPEAYRDAYAVRLTGHLHTPLAEQLSLDVRPYARYSRMDFLQHFLIGQPLEENGQNSVGVLTSLEYVTAAETQLLGGVDLEYADGFLKETQSQPTLGIRPTGKHYDYDVQSMVAALYGSVEQTFARRWHASAGVRGEYVEYQYDNRMLNGNTTDLGTACAGGGCLYSRPADRDDSFTSVTSKVGLTYLLTDNHSIYATAARGYRAPDTSELYRLQRQQSIADLDKEKLDSVELGARGSLAALHYDLSVYTMVKDNVIFRDSNGFNVSDGRTKHRGVEYELSWAALQSLSFSFAGTYAKHTYDFSRNIEQGEQIVAGRDIDTAPRHVNTARVNWLLGESLQTELEWQSVGKYFVDAANAHDYDGHDLLNLRLAWDVSEHWRTTLRLNNVTDEAYADRADYAFGSYRYFPGRGRTTFVEVRYRAM
jgi:iron complex outermembrane receptor protein